MRLSQPKGAESRSLTRGAPRITSVICRLMYGVEAAAFFSTQLTRGGGGGVRSDVISRQDKRCGMKAKSEFRDEDMGREKAEQTMQHLSSYYYINIHALRIVQAIDLIPFLSLAPRPCLSRSIAIRPHRQHSPLRKLSSTHYRP